MKRNNHRRHRPSALALAAGTALFAVNRPAAAQVTRTWNLSTSGNWSVAGNWNPAGVPAAGDTADIVNALSTSLTVTYDYTGPAITVSSLIVDDTGTGTNTLSMAANTLTLSGNEIVGNVGRASFSQTGGNNSVGFQLLVGEFGGSNGSYTLGSGASLSAGNSEDVGFSGGTGTFTQNGGTNTTNALILGNGGASFGNYVLSGGALNLASNAFPALGIGFFGTGSFTQTGGNLNIGSGSRLWIATEAGSHGVYNFSGGSASTTLLTVGGGNSAGGAGILNVSGAATLIVSSELGVLNTAGSSVNFTGGTITAGDLNDLNVPSNFVWTGGTLNLTSSNIVFDSTAAGTAASLGSTLTLNSGQTLALTNGSETIGGGGAGSLTLKTGSTNTISGATTVNPLGTLTLSGGILNTSGTLTNRGSFTFSSGTLNGRVINQGTLTLAPGATFAPSGGVENDTTMTVTAGQTFTINGDGPGLGLDNLGTFTLSGGTVNSLSSVNPSFVNDYGGTMTAWGTVAFTMVNNGILTLGGALTNPNFGSINNGVLNVPPGTLLRGDSTGFGRIINSNLINLTGGAISYTVSNNGVIQGGGSLSGPVSNNAGGIISANTASLPLNLTNFQGNSAGGQIKVADNSALEISNSWTNSGVATLSGPNAVLGSTGSTITNVGTIAGQGTVSASVDNTAGVIRAEGGQLALGGAVTNAAGAQIQASSGATALFAQGLSANSGAIAISGGTFDNNNQPLTNNGSISGNGTIRTGGLTNSATGAISLADLPSSVLGSVSNSGHINITNNTTTFFGTVTNNAGATIKVSTGTSRFLSTFTNNGTFSSDPATNYFQNLTIGTQGVLLGGQGDRFTVAGNFTSDSTQNTAWNTAQALIEFTGGGNHTFSLSGIDRGPSYGGFVNNFSWGILQLDSGNSLTLEPAGSNSAIYLGALVLADGLNQISAIIGNGADIYYDPGNAANAYLAGQSYALVGGGEIAAVPEPAGWLLIVVAGTLLARRRPPILHVLGRGDH